MVNFDDLVSRREKIAVVGLGYVGLPLAVQLSKHFDVVGYDVKTQRINELASARDRTLEVLESELKKVRIDFTDNPEKLSQCRLIIVAVPTPIDRYRIPDLDPLRGASTIVGEHLAKGACVVFESTVYPGATEEVCVPILEERSGYAFGRDFSVGYSPERINPGDRVHTIDKIVKIVSGSDEQATDLLYHVYGQIVPAGIHRASSIKVAEAAKVIENTQRDLNIALMNELSMIFDEIGIECCDCPKRAFVNLNLRFQRFQNHGDISPYFRRRIIRFKPIVINAAIYLRRSGCDIFALKVKQNYKVDLIRLDPALFKNRRQPDGSPRLDHFDKNGITGERGREVHNIFHHRFSG